jgi:hypothetical protein
LIEGMLTALKPVTLVLAMAYSSGAPLFDAVRPAAMDLPLRSFHEDVGLAAQGGLQGLRQLVTAKTIRDTAELLPVGKLFRQVDRELKGATAVP